MMPDSGRPSAPPMPRVALIRATAEPTFSFGSSSRMMLMAIGIIAAAKPCSERPMITVRKTPPTAAMIEPAVIATMHRSIISRLPNMSASLDMIGVATAAVSRAAVTSQEASSGLTSRIPENSWSSGTTMVCCSATTVPDSVRTMMTAQVGDRFRRGADGERRLGDQHGNERMKPTVIELMQVVDLPRSRMTIRSSTGKSNRRGCSNHYAEHSRWPPSAGAPPHRCLARS